MSSNEEKIIVTRHPGLADYIKKIGLVPEDCPTFTKVTNYQVKDKHVFGILPLNLALLASKITIIPFGPARSELRHKELTLEEVEEIALEPRTYIIKQVETQIVM